MTLHAAIKEFIHHCHFEKNLSEKTMKAYQIDLLQLQAFLTPKEVSYIADISKTHLRDYLATLSALKPKSIKRKVAAIKTLFNYMEFEDRILINPFRKMRIKIKEPQILPTVLELSEVIRIFKSGHEMKKQVRNKNSYSYLESIRNIAILELLFTTGARVSEISNLREESINLNSGNITIKGKGNKERIIQLCNKESISILRLYHNLFHDKINANKGCFFINRFNKKLSEQSIRNMVKKIAGNAGIKKHVTPHIFRHSFATLLLEKDVDIKYIQAMLGHSSIMTTQIYTHVNRSRQRQILKSKHPRKDFTMMLVSEEMDE